MYLAFCDATCMLSMCVEMKSCEPEMVIEVTVGGQCRWESLYCITSGYHIYDIANPGTSANEGKDFTCLKLFLRM